MANFPFFNGTSASSQNTLNDLPVFNPAKLTNPKDYQASEELAAAVNVALTLGMPLLLTGEPGCGKSELARRIAWELGAQPLFPQQEQHMEDELKTRLLKYVVKSTTEARDLFYTFDTVGRFHAAQTSRLLMEAKLVDSARQSAQPSVPPSAIMARLDNTVEANQYIEYQALGLALLRAKGAESAKTTLACCPATLTNLPELPQRSIVLIDEIDKAPRDVPNDILSEIENMEFTIPELHGVKISLSEQEQKFRPIVIITSNSERDLPPAFLRRCVYFHVPFPPFAAAEGEQKPGTITVESIVYSRFGKRFEPWPVLLEQALGLCQFLRQQQYPLTKKPSLAEVLNWLDYLQSMTLPAEHKNLMLKDLDQTALLVAIKTTLLKTKTDQARGGELLNQWLSNPHIQPTAE